MCNRGVILIENSFYLANQTHHLHPIVVAYYYKEWNNFQMPFHTHKAIEIMYVISGECIVELKEEKHSMKKGYFIMIDANIPHRLIVDEQNSCRMLNIEFLLEPKQGIYPSIKELAEESSDLKGLFQLKKPYFLLKDTQGLYYTLKSLVLELSDHQKDQHHTIIQTLLSHVLLLVARMAVTTSKRSSQQTDIYIQKVIEHIYHNYDRDLKVADLAALVYLHPSYLHRIFKEKMNCTIMEYITNVRIKKAKMLLSKTDIPITEVSDFVGINSRQYFSYLFKRKTGETPQDFRQKAIQNF